MLPISFSELYSHFITLHALKDLIRDWMGDVYDSALLHARFFDEPFSGFSRQMFFYSINESHKKLL